MGVNEVWTIVGAWRSEPQPSDPPRRAHVEGWLDLDVHEVTKPIEHQPRIFHVSAIRVTTTITMIDSSPASIR
jgi:hypothetical protein